MRVESVSLLFVLVALLCTAVTWRGREQHQPLTRIQAPRTIRKLLDTGPGSVVTTASAVRLIGPVSTNLISGSAINRDGRHSSAGEFRCTRQDRGSRPSLRRVLQHSPLAMISPPHVELRSHQRASTTWTHARPRHPLPSSAVAGRVASSLATAGKDQATSVSCDPSRGLRLD